GDGQGGLWIAYNQERLDHWTPQASISYTSIVRQRDPIHNEPVYLSSVLVDRDHRVWVAAKNRGLFQFRHQQGDFLPAPDADALDPHINALFQDRHGALWVGSAGGLARWDGKSWKLYTQADGLPANPVQAITDDPDGNLWAGTAGGGLACLRAAHFTRYSQADGLPSDDVVSLLVD